MSRPSILVVEDSASVRTLVCKKLSDEGCHVEGIENGREVLKWLDVIEPSLIILDYHLPDMNGKEVVQAIRAKDLNIPFIVITGEGDEKIAVEMMKLGAADYLAKDDIFFDLLPTVVRQVLHASRNKRLLLESRKELVATENRFVALFNHIHSGVAVLEAKEDGEDFVFLDVNPTMERLEGIDGETLLGHSILEAFPGLTQTGAMSLLRQVWSTGREERCKGMIIPSKEGERWLDIQVYRLETGEVVLVYSDVTESKLAEKELSYSRAFEHLIATISSTFVALPTEKLATGFGQALKSLGEFIDADRVVLFRLSSDELIAEFIEGWCSPGTPLNLNSRRRIRLDNLSWVWPQILQHEVVEVSDLEELPPEANSEKKLWKDLEINSLLGVPILSSGRVIGYLGLEMVASGHSWSRSDVRLLRTVGEICGNAMDRQSAYMQLRRNEERLSEALASSKDGAWEWNRGTGEVYISPRYLQTLDYDPDSFPPKAAAFLNIIHPEDKRQVVAVLRKAVQDGEGFEVECRLLSANGKAGTVLLRGRSLNPCSESGGRLVGTLVDISERKRFEDLVLKLVRGISSNTAEGFFNSLVANLADVLGVDFALVGVFNPALKPHRVRTVALYRDGKISESVNYLLDGTPCKEAVVQNGYMCQEDLQSLFPNAPLLAERRAQSYVGVPLVDNEGEAFGVLAVLNQEPLSNIHIAKSLLQVFASRASTELQRQAKEVQLQDSESRYKKLSQEFQTILKGIPDQISLLTPGLDIIWTNRPEESDERVNLFRHCSESIDGKVEACHACPAERCFDTGEVQEGIVSRGDRRYGVKFFPLQHQSREVHSVISMAFDITEKIRLREKSERASRLASLGEVAAGVAHEINNPNALVGLNSGVIKDLLPRLQVVLDHYRDEHGDFSLGKMTYSRLRSELPKLADEIHHSSQRISHIVESLRDFVSPEFSDKKVVFSLVQTAREAVEMVCRIHTDVCIEVKAHADPYIYADADGVKQIIVNLLMNAVQSLEDRTLPILAVTKLDERHHEALLEICDEGCGIAPEWMDKLAEPFFTTKREEGGTGLGLAICSSILKKQGGHMRFESESGRGTTVEVSFPAFNER